MRFCAALISVALLASCGVDGAPVRPAAKAGMTVGTGGVNVGGSVGVSKGPVTISVGL